MNIDEIVQDMRLVSLKEFRYRLERLALKDAEFVGKFAKFIKSCKPSVEDETDEAAPQP